MTVAESAEPRTLHCPRCSSILETTAFAGGAMVECPTCGRQLAAEIFPAFARPPLPVSTSSGEQAQEGEAGCFFHPEKRATLACEECGRFLCALCDLPLGSRHVCPACLDADRSGNLVTSRTLWGNVAFITGVVPLLIGWMMWPFLFVSGLAAIFLAIWGWKKPGSLVRGRRRWAAIVGIIGGLLQIAAEIAMIALMWLAMTRFR